MPASDSEPTDSDPQKRGTTTIRLKKLDETQWLATQDGVPVEGRGESAPAAVAAYCRSVESMNE